MSESAPKRDPAGPAPTIEDDLDPAITICDGDVRAALRATLIANSFLATELDRLTQAVSFGFTRGKISAARRASEKMEEWREISSEPPKPTE